ncbi:MAG: Rrf2 family transcriptional regulator [Anaerolineae bacterium]|jgi:Rrf2 family protein
MLAIRKETDYALRVLLHLTLQPPGTRITTKEVARQRLIPKNLIRRITAHLVNAGFLSSTRGRGGGISLARRPEEIALIDVVETIEGPLVISECVAQPQECPLAKECPVRAVWKHSQVHLRRSWAEITLADLAGQVEV